MEADERMTMSERIPVRTVKAPHEPGTPKVKADQRQPDPYPQLHRFVPHLRMSGAGFLFLLFFGTVWLNWGGRQAVLWDLAESKFHIFGATFWPQDFILLSALLIIAAFGLFAITVFAGRVWCGYTCPQSSWTWMFMWCEKITEGERNQRIKLQAAPWGLNKLARRSAKHTLWLAISVLTGLTFVGYFTPIRPLAEELLTLQLVASACSGCCSSPPPPTSMPAGCAKRCACTCALCAVPERDVRQGHPDHFLRRRPWRNRGPRKREVKPAEVGLGDCIDCQLCVQVCPTGIDIRDGLQMECIGCAACIDACDSIMDKMGYARGLISYTSEHQLQGGKTHLLRPRLIGYTAVLLVMIGALVLALVERPMVSLDVTKDRGLFRENSPGPDRKHLQPQGDQQDPAAPGLPPELVDGDGFQLQGKTELSLAPGEIVDVPVSVAMTTDGRPAARRSFSFKGTAREPMR
jgi:polyferredoxin